MVVIWTLLTVCLTCVAFLLRYKSRRLAACHNQEALDVETRLAAIKQPMTTNDKEICERSKLMYSIGRSVEKRDTVEAKWMKWQKRADGLTDLVASMKGWQGRKLPYTFGAFDLAALLTIADKFGFSEWLSWGKLWEAGKPLVMDLLAKVNL